MTQLGDSSHNRDTLAGYDTVKKHRTNPLGSEKIDLLQIPFVPGRLGLQEVQPCRQMSFGFQQSRTGQCRSTGAQPKGDRFERKTGLRIVVCQEFWLGLLDPGDGIGSDRAIRSCKWRRLLLRRLS